MKANSYQQAIDDLQQAMEYPENLGTGKPNSVEFPYEWYQVGMCYKAMGKIDLARASFTKVKPASSPWYARAAEELKKLDQ